MRMLTLLLIAAPAILAQQPSVENGRLETQAHSGSLPAEMTRFGAGPLWVAWDEPMIPGRHGDMCWSNGDRSDGRAADAPVRLEGQTDLVILVRIENSQVDHLRLASIDCRFDSGGLPFHWLTGVPAAESIAWLRTQVTGNKLDSAISAIALHSDASATQTLQQMTATDQPVRVRERTAFWLGVARGAQGLDTLKRMLANDPDTSVREQVIFAISQSREPSAVATLIDEARNDRSPQIRSRAFFWLAQKAGNQQTISSAVKNDPDRKVREQAVFALKQLPESQGIPLLIDVAKNNPDPEVRKKAMFWLGQSTDPRALDFFAGILK